MIRRRMVIVTGMSGSGKSAALRAFEDMGYYCVDNLPIALVKSFAEFSDSTEEAVRAAIGIDVRGPGFPDEFPGLFVGLRDSGRPVEMLFLEAADHVIVRRFSETRRPHPLARGTVPLLMGIKKERDALVKIRSLADRVIDTSDFTVHDLRQTVERHYAEPGQGRPLVVTLITFGYKFGVPYDMDLMFDLRFLPNPYFVPELKRLTGEDEAVQRYVIERPETREFLSRLLSFMEYLLPEYRREGKSYLMIGFGCTGGRHRSVAVAREVANRLRQSGYDVNLRHRDMGC